MENCIEKYQLEPWVTKKIIKKNAATEELKDFLTAYLAGSWNFRLKVHPQEHFNKTYRGPAIFALMGNKLSGNGKPDLKIPANMVKGALKLLLSSVGVNVPDELDGYLEFGDLDIYGKGVFFDEIKRKDAEKLLKKWKAENPV